MYVCMYVCVCVCVYVYVCMFEARFYLHRSPSSSSLLMTFKDTTSQLGGRYEDGVVAKTLGHEVDTRRDITLAHTHLCIYR